MEWKKASPLDVLSVEINGHKGVITSITQDYAPGPAPRRTVIMADFNVMEITPTSTATVKQNGRAITEATFQAYLTQPGYRMTLELSLDYPISLWVPDMWMLA